MNGDGGAVETTTLNTLADAELATILQSNTISMTGPKNIYIVSTLFYNTTLPTPASQCHGTHIYYAPSLSPANYSTLSIPGVPVSTSYTYTQSAFTYDANYTLGTVLSFSLNSLATEVGSALHLSSACRIGGGGGVGTLKVPVTALTVESYVYVSAQQQQTSAFIPTPTPSVPESAEVKSTAAPASSISAILPITSESAGVKSQVPTASAPEPSTIPTPVSQYVVTESSSLAFVNPVPLTQNIVPPSSSGIPVVFSASPGQETTIVLTTSLPRASGPITLTSVIPFPQASTEVVQTLTFASGIEVITTFPPSPVSAAETKSSAGSYTTTLVETISGETLSEVTTVPLGSVILNFLGGGGGACVSTSTGSGVTGIGSEAGTSTTSGVAGTKTVGGSQTGTSTTSTAPAEFTGAARSLTFEALSWPSWMMIGLGMVAGALF